MTRRGKDPTQAPQHDRSIRIDWLQRLGVPLLLIVPIVVLVGVHGESWREVVNPITRIAFIYFFLMVALRIMGKREMSEMSPFEIVTLLMVPEIFSSTLGREEYTLTESTLGVSTLFVLVFLTGLLTFRFKRIEQVVEGEPTVLVDNGRLVEGNLKRERVTAEEVYTEMHKGGISDVKDVRWAILEVDGKISVIPRSEPRGGRVDPRKNG